MRLWHGLSIGQKHIYERATIRSILYSNQWANLTSGSTYGPWKQHSLISKVASRCQIQSSQWCKISSNLYPCLCIERISATKTLWSVPKTAESPSHTSIEEHSEEYTEGHTEEPTKGHTKGHTEGRTRKKRHGSIHEKITEGYIWRGIKGNTHVGGYTIKFNIEGITEEIIEKYTELNGVTRTIYGWK